MALTIPKKFHAALGKFVSLPPLAIATLVKGAQQAAPASSIRIFASSIENTPETDLPEDDRYDIFLMLGSLCHVRAAGNWPSLADFVGDLIDAAKRDEVLALHAPEEGWPKLASNLQMLLDVDGSLAISAKASELRTEHQRFICIDNSRVLTDLRPVFLENVEQHPRAVMIQHTLKIAYHDDSGRESKELFVALDGDGLRRLKNLIERAIAKESNLRIATRIEGAVIIGASDVANGIVK